MKIDLGREPNEGNLETVEPAEVFYPTLYLDNVKGAKNIPASGKAVISYVKTSYSVNETNGEKNESCTLDVTDIEFREGKKKKNEKVAETEYEESLSAIEEGIDAEMEKDSNEEKE